MFELFDMIENWWILFGYVLLLMIDIVVIFVLISVFFLMLMLSVIKLG